MRKLMRRLKWVVIGLFAVVVALLVAAYAIVSNYPVDDLKALIQDEVRKATGRELVIDGTLEMEVLPSPAIVMNGVRLQNASWGVQPEMLTVGHVEAEVAFWPLINGDIEVRRLVLNDAAVSLERSAEGEANWRMGEGGGTGTLPHFADVHIEKARVAFDDRQGGVAATLDLDELAIASPDATAPMAVALKGRFDTLPLDLKLTLPAAAALLGGGVQPVEIAGQVADATVSLVGRLGPWQSGANDFRLIAEGKELRSFVADAPPGPFRLEATVQQKGVASVALSDLKGTLAGADFHGRLDLSTAEPVPRVEGELHLGKLALPAGEAGSGASGSLFPATPLPYHRLKAVDAKLVLTVEQLISGGRVFSDVATRLALEHGSLMLDPLGFAYGGGTFTGKLQIDAAATPPTTKVSLTGTGLPLGVASDGLLQGSLDVDLDLVARGDNPKAMAASLDGHTAVSSGAGTIDSHLASLAEAPLATILQPLTGGGGQTKFNCLINRMAWKAGIGTNEGTALDADGFTVVGNGTVDLRNETIDFYADVWSKDAVIVGVTVPMIVRGPLANPSVHPDPGGTALGIAKTAGLIVFPPAGLAAIIDRQKPQEGNACVAAVKKVEEGGGAGSFFDDAGKAIGDTVDTIGKGAGDAIDTIGEGAEDAIEGLKGLFSN